MADLAGRGVCADKAELKLQVSLVSSVSFASFLFLRSCFVIVLSGMVGEGSAAAQVTAIRRQQQPLGRALHRVRDLLRVGGGLARLALSGLVSALEGGRLKKGEAAVRMLKDVVAALHGSNALVGWIRRGR